MHCNLLFVTRNGLVHVAKKKIYFFRCFTEEDKGVLMECVQEKFASEVLY